MKASALDALALALCGGWLLAALLATAGAPLLTPDSTHYALVARNLLAGRGYVIEVVPFHPGWFDSTTRVPEMHGLLRPLLLAPLFAVLGSADEVVRIPGLVYVALTGLVAFAFARNRFGAAAGLLACLLTLSSDLLGWYGWAGTDDVGFAFYFLWALYCFDRGLESGRTGAFAWAGVAAGLGLLEKLTGLLFLPLFVCAWLLFRKAPGRATPRRVGLALAPLALALVLYLARNFAAHGGPGFRFSPLAWMLKTRGYDGFFALYEQAPTFSWVVSQLGWTALPGIALGELAKLAEHVFRWPGPGAPLGAPQSLAPLALGVPSLLVHARSRPRFAALGALSVLGAAAFVCGFHHVETRYFAMLVPLLWVSLAGAVADGLRSRAPGWRGHALRGAGLAGLLAAVALAAPGSIALWTSTRLARLGRTPCEAAFAALDRVAEPDDRVLAFNPWLVAWRTGHAAVKVPSGGSDAVARVAQHYGTRWLLLTRTLATRATEAELRSWLADPPPPFSTARVAGGPSCELFELAPTRPASVVLFVIDTLRFDAVSANGVVTGTTPALDRLAARGLRYTRAYSHAPWTLPSHTSLFTGLLPSQHGVGWKRTHAPENLLMLAERLSAAGWQTFGYSENVWVSPAFGTAQGFDDFRFRGMGRKTPEALEEALEGWLRGRDPKRPFFLFVNVIDPHWPYRSSRDNPFLPAGTPAGTADLLGMLRSACASLPADQLAVLRGLYLGDVREADAKLGRTHALFEAAGLGDSTLWIVTSDHGEQLGEHGLLEHQFSLREPLVHVPLVVQGQPGGAAGVIDTPVQHADIVPTILAWAGLPADPALRGRPLPTRDAAAGAARTLVAEYSDPGDVPAREGRLAAGIRREVEGLRASCPADANVFGDMRAVLRPPWKLIWYAKHEPELMDLDADPGEIRNLASARPEALRELLDELPEAAARTHGGAAEASDSESVRRELEALGYLREGQEPARD